MISPVPRALRKDSDTSEEAAPSSTHDSGSTCTGMHDPLTHYPLSRYSPGTSSCGTSCVRTSPSSASPASCTPFTASASKAFPSSSISSTLSEFAPSRLDNPCKSPGCPPERATSPSGANATVSTVWLFPRTRFLAARAVLPRAIFLAPALVFASAFFGAEFFFASFALSAFLTGFTFLPAILFVCFLLVFFLAAIRAVYHPSGIPSAWASPDRRAGRRGGRWRQGRAGPSVRPGGSLGPPIVPVVQYGTWVGWACRARPVAG